MKNISYLLGLTCLLGVLLYACNESNLDLTPGTLTEGGFFQDETQIDLAVLGTYAKLTDFYWYRGNDFVHDMRHLPGDDLTTLGDYPFETFGPLQPGTDDIGYFYQAAYEMVNRANTALQGIETAEEGTYQTEGLQDTHRGEALFLRAYAYFNLWNYFGTAPLITERIQGGDELNNPNSQGNQLLDQAIEDFTEATGLLPESWDETNRGRVTANAARGFLGKALVFRATVNDAPADYTSAITAFDQIEGRALADHFKFNFSPEHENNIESLFEFQAGQSPTNDNVWLPNDFDAAVGSMSAYWGFFDGNFSLFGQLLFIPSPKLIETFEEDDPRVDFTFNPADTTMTKYVFNDLKSNTGVGSLNNPRILRYADVLLLKAEALVASGGSTTEAIELVNQIRTRARNSTDSTASVVPANYDINQTDRDTIMEWIMNERFLELVGEEAHRWFDLRRWHLGGRIDLVNWDFSSARSDFAFDVDTHLYFPIPSNEVDLNPNIVQNPGY
ncbi:MAG: RagB/SusD family nutrient uptake outer membrane protein [Bacteroidota bacterium]